MFGYADAGDLTGRHLGSLYLDAQQWFQTADYFQAQKEFDDLIVECVRKGGSPIVVRISGRVIPNGREGSFRLSWKTSPKPEPSNCSFGKRKRWKRSGAWPAASHTTLTIC